MTKKYKVKFEGFKETGFFAKPSHGEIEINLDFDTARDLGYNDKEAVEMIRQKELYIYKEIKIINVNEV